MFRKAILALGLTAMVAGPAQTPLIAASPVKADDGAKIAPPMRTKLCEMSNPFASRSEEAIAYASPPPVIAAPPPAYAPPPPSPPPPAPAPVAPPPLPGNAPETKGFKLAPKAGATQRAAPQAGAVRPGGYTPGPADRERYAKEEVAGIKAVQAEPVSTFSIDVDTGAYANMRRFLTQGRLPPSEAVRTEELLNYFRYDYALPKDKEQPFSVTADVAQTPWNKDTRLVRVGLRGYDLPYKERPRANLVFLVDVSGSMDTADKLPLVQAALNMAADKVRPQDRVSIVVYSGTAGVLLSPCNDPAKIKAAVATLYAEGSTAGGQAMKLAYSLARAQYDAKGINRIVMATDGDFNVGTTSSSQLEDMVERERKSGISLTMLGFGSGNYNEAMMESVADKGNGNYSYIDTALEARKVMDEELASTLFTIAGDVKIQVEFNPAYVAEYRLIGYENRALAEEDFDNDKVDAGEIGASHQVTALYEIVPAGAKGWLPDRRYDGNKPDAAAGAKNGEFAYLKLRYKLPGQDQSKLIERPLSAATLARAPAPSGDMAFATAVAAFGQILRGDKYLGEFSYPGVLALAGDPQNYYRAEFVKLVGVAMGLEGRRASAQGGR